jgi:hypothetical protein
MLISKRNREVVSHFWIVIENSARSGSAAYVSRGTKYERRSVLPQMMEFVNVRSTQKRGFIFDPDEVASSQAGFVKKYKKG